MSSYSEPLRRWRVPTVPGTARLGLAVVALLALGACGNDSAPSSAADQDQGTRPGYATLTGTDPDTDAATSPSADASTDPAPTATPTRTPSEQRSDEPDPDAATDDASDGPAPELITYAGGEAQPPTIEDVAQARKVLVGAPRDFQDFIGEQAEKFNATADCDGAAVGVSVDVVRTDGFAAGGVNECGGYAAMWAKVDGSWEEIEATQDAWDCGPLWKYDVPSAILLGKQVCYDYDGDGKEHTYRQE